MNWGSVKFALLEKPRQYWAFRAHEKSQSMVWPWEYGGGYEDRTHDLLIANQTLSHLS